MEMKQWHDVTPDPGRITTSFRDTGYELNTAIADIIDNSIAANATEIHVEFDLDILGDMRFSVADNGDGMSLSGLVNALRYGSAKREDAASLGKFGLGLKTASTAFARRIIVTSRDTSNSSANTCVWDLDEVDNRGWALGELAEPAPFDHDLLNDLFPNHAGTVVRWEKIDKVLEKKYQAPTGNHAVNFMKKKCESLEEHLALVFQRFLDPDDPRESKKVKLFLNRVPVLPWNPFAWNAQELDTKKIDFEGPDGSVASVLVRSFILPRQEELKAFFGPQKSQEAKLVTAYQGIYVYRENRLIHGPDWLKIWSKEPHLNLLRVELSFGHELDDAFQVDIKKSQIKLDEAVLKTLEKILNIPRQEANRRYRKGQTAAVVSNPATLTMHNTSNAVISDVAPMIGSAELVSVDPLKEEALITNSHGAVKVKYVGSFDAGVFVEAVPELPHKVFFEPAYIGSNPGVRINKSHPYYAKVYLPNSESGTTIQALDSLLWALASAEFKSTQDSMRETFEEIRIDVSRALARLVEDLPDAPEPDL